MMSWVTSGIGRINAVRHNATITYSVTGDEWRVFFKTLFLKVKLQSSHCNTSFWGKYLNYRERNITSQKNQDIKIIKYICLIWIFFIFLHPIAIIKFGKEMSERYKDYGCHTLYWMAFIAFPLAFRNVGNFESRSRWNDDRLHIGALLYPYLVVPL